MRDSSEKNIAVKSTRWSELKDVWWKISKIRFDHSKVCKKGYYKMKHLDKPVEESGFIRPAKKHFCREIQVSIYLSNIMKMERLAEILVQLQERNEQELSRDQDKVKSRELDGNRRGRGGSGLNIVRWEVEWISISSESRYNNYEFRMRNHSVVGRQTVNNDNSQVLNNNHRRNRMSERQECNMMWEDDNQKTKERCRRKGCNTGPRECWPHKYISKVSNENKNESKNVTHDNDVIVSNESENVNNYIAMIIIYMTIIVI